MPNRVSAKPYSSPIAIATTDASTTSTIQFQPCRTDSTPTRAPDSPLTDPTDRSISPTSSTHTMPSEMMPTAQESSVRFTRFALDRNIGLSDWKMVQIRRSPTTTGSAPTSPARTLRQNACRVPRNPFCCWRRSSTRSSV